MAQIDEGQQIFSKPHGVISWNETKGQKLVNTISIDENKRGIHKEWGFIGEAGKNIDILLKEWSNLEFFLKASIEADVGIRGQTPLNLFDEREQAGLALQLQAIAQAAIAIGLDIDLTIGELMDELHIYPDADNFLTELLKIILEETKIEGVMYAQAAIAVMAYAHLIITGSFFSNEQHEDGTGFKIIFDGGYGFIAGGGYRCYIQANMTNPRNLISRASDLTVTECMKKVSPFSEIRIMEAPLKMGLRLAYLLGENLRRNFIVGDPRINQTTIIIVEEGQSWFLHQFNKFARENMQDMIRNIGISTHFVPDLLPELNKRATSIEEMKKNLDTIIDLSLKIAPYLPPAYKEPWLKQACIIWASMNLYISISEQQLKESNKYFSYQGSLGITIPDTISNVINKDLGKPISNILQIQHLMTFLFDNTLAPLLQQQNDISYVIEIYKSIFSGNNEEVVQHLFNFIPADASSTDKDTLVKLYDGLNTFYKTYMIQINELLEKEIPPNSELMYVLNHSILPSLTLLLDVIIPEMLNGFPNGEGKKKNMVEALSSTLLPLVGRSLIQIQNGILSRIKDQLGNKLMQAAKELKNIDLPDKFNKYIWEQFVTLIIPRPLHTLINKIGQYDKDFNYKNQLINFMISPIQRALELMAEFIQKHPYPKKVFSDMEDVLTPIDEWQDTLEFYTELAKPEWIPQEKKVIALLKDLGEYMLVDMQEFSAEMIIVLLNAMLTKLLEDVILSIKLIQYLLITLLEEIIKDFKGIVMKPLVDLFIHEPLKVIDKLPEPLKGKAHQELIKIVENGVTDQILSPIINALKGWQIDAKVIIDAFRVKELNYETFSSVIIKQIEHHLYENIKGNLGFNVNFNISMSPDIIPGGLGVPDVFGILDLSIPVPDIPVPDIPVPDIPVPDIPVPDIPIPGVPDVIYPFNFGNIYYDSTSIISVVSDALLKKFHWNQMFDSLNFSWFIKLVYSLEDYFSKYKDSILEQKGYYTNLTRDLPAIITIRDTLLIVQPHKEHKDYIEIFIHFPDNNAREDNVVIKLNETEIPIECFSFQKNTRFLYRKNNALLYGVAPFDKLKNNINILHVFYQNMETMLSFSIE
ncbi:hypothetical protein COF07_12135 [Bacillus wiedmannii]|uniref:hypothetical protein n=1 Tax=Bacillus wiedmannii TaxID=1890302 RepID=UPI000BFD4BD1|nr:hypothetical protein [Bacillus wiedmannii]PHA57860.1 hypothetical protein COF07_12135 [Bacillus wiedmannii]